MVLHQPIRKREFGFCHPRSTSHRPSRHSTEGWPSGRPSALTLTAGKSRAPERPDARLRPADKEDMRSAFNIAPTPSPGKTTAPAAQGPSQRFLSSRHSVQVCERLSSRRGPPAPPAIAILSFTKPGGSLEAWRPCQVAPFLALHPPQTGVTQKTT